MPAISEFVDPVALRSFQRAIPRIRTQQIGQCSWDAHDWSFGVEGNTFRAYTGWRSSPSATFRAWASKTSQRLLRTRAEDVGSQALFDDWHFRMAQSLQRAWHKAQGKGLGVAHKYKLVDLYVKWLTGHRLPDVDLLARLTEFGHCALDRQTLGLANAHLSHAMPMHKPFMGHIKTEATYAFCQSVIREYCELAGGTPILFDYFAWRRGA